MSEQQPRRDALGDRQILRLVGARGNNLKDVTAEIPLGTFCCVSGVSGGGKSTLIVETIGHRGGAPGCRIGLVDGALPDANARARALADRQAPNPRCAAAP